MDKLVPKKSRHCELDYLPVADQPFLRLLVLVHQSGTPNASVMTSMSDCRWLTRSSFAIRKHWLQPYWMDELRCQTLSPTDLVRMLRSIRLCMLVAVSPKYSSLGYPQPDLAYLPVCGRCCMPQLREASHRWELGSWWRPKKWRIHHGTRKSIKSEVLLLPVTYHTKWKQMGRTIKSSSKKRQSMQKTNPFR